MQTCSTERLVLETVGEIDAPALFPIWSDHDVTKFTMIRNIRGIDDCKARIRRQMGWGAENSIGPFVIKEEGRVIGYCGGRKNESDEMEIFYHIARDRWGQGLGTEIARKLVDMVFEERKASRVKAEAVVQNVASWKILERLGMKRVEVKEDAFENEEGIFDFYVYTIEARDRIRSRTPAPDHAGD